MSRLTVAIFILISNLSFAADAQERVVIGTRRLSENGALFMAAAQGYFRAEGIDLAMTAYDSDKAVADMLASGVTDLGLARFTPAAFDAAGKGLIRAIGAGARETRLRRQSDHRLEHWTSKRLAQVRQSGGQDDRHRRTWIDSALPTDADRAHQ